MPTWTNPEVLRARRGNDAKAPMDEVAVLGVVTPTTQPPVPRGVAGRPGGLQPQSLWQPPQVAHPPQPAPPPQWAEGDGCAMCPSWREAYQKAYQDSIRLGGEVTNLRSKATNLRVAGAKLKEDNRGLQVKLAQAQVEADRAREERSGAVLQLEQRDVLGALASARREAKVYKDQVRAVTMFGDTKDWRAERNVGEFVGGIRKCVSGPFNGWTIIGKERDCDGGKKRMDLYYVNPTFAVFVKGVEQAKLLLAFIADVAQDR